MEKIEYRSVIKFLYLEGASAKEIHERLVKVYGDGSPSIRTVQHWVWEFRNGRTTLVDDPREGRPKTATTPEVTARIQDLLMVNRQLTERDLSEALQISSGSVGHILNDILGFRKLLGKWVPRTLTMEQKHVRMRLAQQHLKHFTEDKQDFVRRFITMDHTWISNHPDDSGAESEQSDFGSTPKRIRVAKKSRPEKAMVTIAWDAKGVLLADYQQQRQQPFKAIDSGYYCGLLDRLAEKIGEKRPELHGEKVLFHQDQTPCHASIKVMAKINELQFELFDHPPNSPDLAPCDYHLFPELKNYMCGQRRLTSNHRIITAIEGYLAGLQESHFSIGISALEGRWTKCIAAQGDYIELIK